MKGINSFNRAHVEELSKGRMRSEILSKPVQCMTLDEIVRKYNYWNFNLLMIDTEGFDYEIIQSINFTNFSPEMIYFEHIHLNKEQMKDIDIILTKHNYRQLVNGINTLAYRAELQ